MELRGAGFVRAQEVMWALSRTKPFISSETKHNIGLLHVGACSPGMNTVVRAFVTLSELSGFATYGIRSGLTGLQNGDFYEMTANDVVTWSSLGGAKLGTSRYSPSEMNIGLIALQLQKHEIQTLVMMGGWDGYICMMQLKKKAHKYPYLQKVNIMIIPCTISNNLPCTDYSIGADTALNSIVSAVDKIKESAIAQRRVFVIEVMGAYCGFLCSMGAFATGAEKAYVPEEPPTLESLQKDLQDVKDSFENNKTMAIFFTTEKTSKVFDTKFLSKLFRIDSNDQFDVRVSILGHLQQGGSPSPMDRFLGVELVGETMKHISAYVEENKEGLFHVVGFTNGEVSFSDKDQILEQQDMKYRRPKNSWWTRTYVFLYLILVVWKITLVNNNRAGTVASKRSVRSTLNGARNLRCTRALRSLRRTSNHQTFLLASPRCFIHCRAQLCALVQYITLTRFILLVVTWLGFMFPTRGKVNSSVLHSFFLMNSSRSGEHDRPSSRNESSWPRWRKWEKSSFPTPR